MHIERRLPVIIRKSGGFVNGKARLGEPGGLSLDRVVRRSGCDSRLATASPDKAAKR